MKHLVYGTAGIRGVESSESASGELDAVLIHEQYKKLCLFRKKVLNVVPQKARRRAMILLKCLLTVNLLTDSVCSMWLL